MAALLNEFEQLERFDAQVHACVYAGSIDWTEFLSKTIRSMYVNWIRSAEQNGGGELAEEIDKAKAWLEEDDWHSAAAKAQESFSVKEPW